jgi:hypothetical protein
LHAKESQRGSVENEAIDVQKLDVKQKLPARYTFSEPRQSVFSASLIARILSQHAVTRDLFSDLRYFGPLKSKVIHQALCPEYKADDGSLNIVRINRPSRTQRDERNRAIYADFPAI